MKRITRDRNSVPTSPAQVPVMPMREALSSSVSSAEARHRRPGLGIGCLLLLLLTLGSVGHVAVHFKHLEVGLALGKARREQNQLRERQRKLELEIGVLKDPERVISIAHDRLGLRRPSVSDLVPLSELTERVRHMLATDPASGDDPWAAKPVPHKKGGG